jgi:hypothetical protein
MPDILKMFVANENKKEGKIMGLFKEISIQNNVVCKLGYCYYDGGVDINGEAVTCIDCPNSTFNPYDNKIKMCGTITWVQLLYSMFKNVTVKELIEKGGMCK